jgi:DNA repair protein RadA/Sms
MAAATQRYACQECGATHGKWTGRCDACGGWNTVVEEIPREQTPRGLGGAAGRRIELVDLQGADTETRRLVIGIDELDRVVGGGLVAGSALLVAGDPGIGKSTILLQAAASCARGGAACVYISGEESPEQVRLRARRLGLADAPLKLAAATSVRDILTSLEAGETPDVVIIDSIQTMFIDSLDSAPGSVAQVRGSAQELIRFAKRSGAVVILVGHVTKDGQIAGPRVLEHMVDTVLYFEGERSHQFRILRAVKNRFGPTDEIGVFKMTDAGLREVPNPSALFLSEHGRDISGAAVFAGVEGSRPVLVEIQALVAPSSLGTPRRAVVGWDSGRLAMVMAVLDARCGLSLGGNDVYLNVAGGLKISEPAADLAVAAALISAISGRPLPANSVTFGEVGLSGEIRQVNQSDVRLKEAAKLGFEKALMPRRKKTGPGEHGESAAPLAVLEIARLADLVDLLSGDR